LALWRGRHDGSGRLLAAATYDPNDMALILNVAMPLALWWFYDRGSRGRFLGLAVLPLLVYVSFEANSRGGFLGLGAILVAFLYIGMSGRVQRLRKVALTTVILTVLAIPVLPSSVLERITSIADSGDYNMNSPRGRWNIWKRGLGYAATHPLTGVGIANFSTAEGHLSDEAAARGGSGWKWSTAHNSYLQALAELGFAGGIIFFLLIGRTAKTLITWRAPPRPGGQADPLVDLLPPFLGMSFAGYAVSGFFLSFAYTDCAYYLLALALATLMRAERATADAMLQARQAPRGAMAPGPRRPLAPAAYAPPIQTHFPAPPPPARWRG
jgi:O-antigen ligase